MDGEAIIYLIFLVIWFVSGIVAQIRKMTGQVPEEPEGEPFLPPVPGQGQEPVRRSAPPPVPSTRPISRPMRQERPAAPPAASPPDAVRELFRQLGVELVEQPVASEHRPTASEHRRTLSEHRQSTGETRATLSEHRSTISETRRTASEHRQAAGETQRTASEHRRGDVSVPARAPSPPAQTRRRTRSRVIGEVRHELLNGPETLKKALVLKEILDAPVGQRPI